MLISAQESIYTNDDGFWPSVYRVDVTTGKSRKVVGGHGSVLNWFADGDGNVRAGEGYVDDTRTSRLLYRTSDKGTFRTIDRADYRKGEKLYAPFAFIKNTDHGYVIHDNDQASQAFTNMI